MSTTTKWILTAVFIGLLFVPVIGEIEGAGLAIVVMVGALWGLKSKP